MEQWKRRIECQKSVVGESLSLRGRVCISQISADRRSTMAALAGGGIRNESMKAIQKRLDRLIGRSGALAAVFAGQVRIGEAAERSC